VNIKRLRDGSIELSQRALISTIIKNVDLEDSKVKSIPAKSNKHLHAHLDKPEFALNFNYRSLIGKLKYLAQTTQPDIMYAMHQLALFKPSGTAWRTACYLVCYLKKTHDIGTVFNLIVQKILNAIATPTSPELGTSNLLIATQAQQNPEAVGLSSMQTVQSFGHQSCRPRLLFPRPKLNISPCLNPCEMSFPSCFLFKR
jgi:hypothetical protein